MCGIIGAFNLKTNAQDLRPQVLEMSKESTSPRTGLVGNILRRQKQLWHMNGFRLLILNREDNHCTVKTENLFWV